MADALNRKPNENPIARKFREQFESFIFHFQAGEFFLEKPPRSPIIKNDEDGNRDIDMVIV